MRPLPEPLDGTGAGRSRSTDETARIPRLTGDGYVAGPGGQPSPARFDDDQIGQAEQGWYDRLRADLHRTTNARFGEVPAGRHAERPAVPAYRDRGGSDLPGPSRAELARLIRQVRALIIVLILLFAGLHAYVLVSPYWRY